MIDYIFLQDKCDDGFHVQKKKRKKVSNTIYTFDLESSNLFKYGSRYDVFDYSKKPEYYARRNKLGLCYIWQFGINDKVYFGRELSEFKSVLETIADQELMKVIWIHNLSFEMTFLENILDEYTITDMCARDVRKPISFIVKELNIMFRCSYMLTNLSLEKAAEEYTNIEKLKTLDYDAKVRTPLTKLSDEELKYCEYDIKCLYEIIKHYRSEYKSIAQIPLTATSEVRKALQKHVDFYYIKHQWDLVPDPKMYLRLMAAFQGGYTHANMLNANEIIDEVISEDETSAYPWTFFEKFPRTPFLFISYDDYLEKDPEKYAFLFKVKIYDATSKYYNNYISYSRCESVDEKSLVYDNGRIAKCKKIELWCTDVDLDIIKKCYKYKKIVYEEIYFSEKYYLDLRVLQFVLELYGNKTKLKGVKAKEDLYKKSKGYINSLYGMSVTNPLKNSAEYDNGWSKKELNSEFVNEVIQNAKSSYSTLFFYAVGVWVTAYARRNLFMTLIKLDEDVIYCDTDSIKYVGNHNDIFQEYNRNVYKHYKEICEVFPKIKLEMFMPKDKFGIKHPLGMFEIDGKYKQFITLGAKKYCYVDDKGLHITVSGVSKKGAAALKSIKDFKKGFVWDYKHSGKLAHFYNDEQEQATIIDADGNEYENKYLHGVILQPTTYKLGQTDEYLALIELVEDGGYRP